MPLPVFHCVNFYRWWVSLVLSWFLHSGLFWVSSATASECIFALDACVKEFWLRDIHGVGNLWSRNLNRMCEICDVFIHGGLSSALEPQDFAVCISDGNMCISDFAPHFIPLSQIRPLFEFTYVNLLVLACLMVYNSGWCSRGHVTQCLAFLLHYRI